MVKSVYPSTSHQKHKSKKDKEVELLPSTRHVKAVRGGCKNKSASYKATLLPHPQQQPDFRGKVGKTIQCLAVLNILR